MTLLAQSHTGLTDHPADRADAPHVLTLSVCWGHTPDRGRTPTGSHLETPNEFYDLAGAAPAA